MLVCCSAPLIRPYHARALKTSKSHCQLTSPMHLCLFPFQLKWKCRKDDETNGGYSRDLLLKLLQKVNVLTYSIGGVCLIIPITFYSGWPIWISHSFILKIITMKCVRKRVCVDSVNVSVMLGSLILVSSSRSL